MPTATALAQNAEGWFLINPVSAPGMTLAAIDQGAGGSVTGLDKVSANPLERWNFVPKGDNVYVIRSNSNPPLVLTAQGGGKSDGTPAVLEPETDSPTQLWSLKKNDNGTLSFVPQYAPDMALDDLGGGNTVGARQDVWTYNPADEHLQWIIKPLDDAKMPALAADQPKVIILPGQAVFNRVRFYPAPGHEKDMVGGKFFGSNVSATDGFDELAEIKDMPPANQWTELTFPNTKIYRWIKYQGAPGSYSWVSKMDFYDGDQRLQGDDFGVWPDAWRRVLDGGPADPNSRFQGVAPDGQYFGVDLRDKATDAWPAVNPGQGEYPKPITVTMTPQTPGAVIRYTTDGTIPTTENGQVYSAPIPITTTTTLCAVAFTDGKAPTPYCNNTYIIGSAIHRTSFDVGNSLTGITGRYPSQAYTAGYQQDMEKFLIGGGLTKALWNTAMLPLGDPADKDHWIDLYSTKIGQTIVYPLADMQRAKDDWAALWPKVTTIDDFTLQPRDFDIAEEADYDNRFLNIVLQKAPDVQPWLYVEWTEKDRQRPTDLGKEPTTEMKTIFPAMTWEESMGAMILYGEDLKRKVEETYKGKKPLRIIPAALAMGWIHNMIENGQVPGIDKDKFYDKLFSDTVHVNAEGAYLVDCTWYAAFSGESPEGKFLPVLTSLSPEQARIMQRLAWDAVKNYPYSGYYEEGTTPCGKPVISPVTEPIQDNAPVTLSSSTPGAWFRYTLDGTTPTRTNGYIYCGVITVRPGMTLKTLAYKSGMADSDVTEMAYPAKP